MIIAQYFVEFIFYSFLGWCWESVYCTIREKHWADRGFLFGPICPIYGSCGVGGSIAIHLFPALSAPTFPIWAIFLISMAASVVVEYLTSYILEKRFHARWWDYSGRPLNLNGRIWLPYTIAFGFVGILVVKVLVPMMSRTYSVVHPLIYETLAILFAMAFGADFALTEAALSALLKNMQDMHAEFNEKAQQTYVNLASTPKRVEAAIASAPKRVSNAIVEKKDVLVEAVTDKKDEFVEAVTDKKDEFVEAVTDKKDDFVEAVATTYAGKLSGFQRHMLHNMQHFRPWIRSGENKEYTLPEGRTIGEHLKAALDKLEEKEHK